MSALEIILLIVGVVILFVVGIRKANHNYTLGSGMFKNSDNNLERDKYNDPSDFNYYNKNDKLK